MFNNPTLRAKAAQKITDSEALDAVVSAFAEMERQQREALREHLDALGHPDPEAAVEDLPSHEDRKAEMFAALRSKIDPNQAPWDLYAEHLAPESLNTEAAREYRDLDPDEWEAQKAEWVRLYRDGAADLSDMSDEDLVEHYVRKTFGVTPETFRREVVEWTGGATYHRVMAGPFQEHTEHLRRATETVEQVEPSDELVEDSKGGE